MRNLKYIIISAMVFLLTTCSTQNFYMSQGDNNKNEPKLTEPSNNEDKSGEKEKDDKIPDEKEILRLRLTSRRIARTQKR